MPVLRFFLALTMLATLTLGGQAAWADEISDQLKKGVQLYEEGKISEAVNEIQFALAQMRQKKAELLTGVFPAAPSGWKADKAEAQSAAAGILGGGINVTRRYSQDGGKGSASLELISDSPLIQSLGVLMSNPMFLQSSRQGKLLNLEGGQKAIFKNPREGRGELQTLIDNKVLLKIEVRKVEDAEAVCKQFYGLVDLAKLRELTQ